RKVEDRPWFNAAAIKVDQISSRRGTQALKPLVGHVQRHTALVTTAEGCPGTRALAPISNPKSSDIALILIRYEPGSVADLFEFLGQEKTAIDRASIQNPHIRIAEVTRPAFALRHVDPNVYTPGDSARHAVGEDNRSSKKYIWIFNIAEESPPVDRVELKQAKKILGNRSFKRREPFRTDCRTAASLVTCER